ncbi:amidase [Amycolatopsis marina]|uniref:amidase n=1 Tax=Amycolatopsis marina TaxID=490629 RepID=UPI0015A55AC9|nr:amidase [Amycolatopsis marina]
MREQVERQLRRVGERDPQLHAMVVTLERQALRDADRLDAGSGPREALHGLTVTLKDNIDVAGVPTTAGSGHHARGVAPADAAVTRLLRQAGAVVMGKNNMAEFAMGVTGRNRTFGDCRNAWDRDRIAGGSSSGSAVAVAAGMSTAALGTDTGGSGRIPAAVNGIVGMRPTVGRVSNRGVLPVSPSFDTVTPMARDVHTVAAVLAALEHWAPDDPTSGAGGRIAVGSCLEREPERLRVGLPREFFDEGVDPGVQSVIRSAVDTLRGLGAQVRDVDVPDAGRAQERMLDIMYPEAAAVHADRLRYEPDTIDPDVLRRLRLGQGVTAERTRQARAWQLGFQRRVDAVFDDVDVVVTPTIPLDVPLHDAVDLAASTREIARFTYAWSMYGGPSISIPCGFHPRSGMPVGLQLSGARWDDHVVLMAAAAYERTMR